MGAKSWEVTDAFWSRVEPLVPARRERVPEKTFVRKPGGGRKPKPARVVFEAIVFVLRTGCQWKALPACQATPGIDPLATSGTDPPTRVDDWLMGPRAGGTLPRRDACL